MREEDVVRCYSREKAVALDASSQVTLGRGEKSE